MRVAHNHPGDALKRWRWVDLHPGVSLLTEYGGSPMLIGAEAITLPGRLVASPYDAVAVQ